jgi:hypothetical protein
LPDIFDFIRRWSLCSNTLSNHLLNPFFFVHFLRDIDGNTITI